MQLGTHAAAATAAAGPKQDDPKHRAIAKAAEDFTGQFMSEMLSHMTDGTKADKLFGGGHGEEMFRSLLVNEYGKMMAARGASGLTQAVQRAMLKAQEG
jgi:Rod binding domain-containing protein